MSNHVHGKDCPHCGHNHTTTVDAHVEGRGALQTYAIVECDACGQLWGERRNWMGVYDE